MTTDNHPNQMDIDDCLIHDAKKTAMEYDGNPFIGELNWPKMVLDMVRIIERLRAEKEELLQAVHRITKE